jgi:hypothetical protein
LSHQAIKNLELRIEALKRKVAHRESLQSAKPSDGQLSVPDVFIQSARTELHTAALEYIVLKCQSGAWSPTVIINAMRLK